MHPPTLSGAVSILLKLSQAALHVRKSSLQFTAGDAHALTTDLPHRPGLAWATSSAKEVAFSSMPGNDKRPHGPVTIIGVAPGATKRPNPYAMDPTRRN